MLNAIVSSFYWRIQRTCTAHIKGALRWKIPFPAQFDRLALVGKCRENIAMSFKYFVVVSHRQCVLNLRENRLRERGLHIYCHIQGKASGSRLCGRTADGTKMPAICVEVCSYFLFVLAALIKVGRFPCRMFSVYYAV